jgi:hypothetical protein
VHYLYVTGNPRSCHFNDARKFYFALGFTECPGQWITLVVTLQDIRAAWLTGWRFILRHTGSRVCELSKKWC